MLESLREYINKNPELEQLIIEEKKVEIEGKIDNEIKREEFQKYILVSNELETFVDEKAIVEIVSPVLKKETINGEEYITEKLLALT